MNNDLEKIEYNGIVLAIIIKNNFHEEGVTFFTPDDFSQQLAFMKHPKGRVIDAHVHNIVTREVKFTKEILFIKKGKLRVDFYNEDKLYLKTRILEQGDVILLAEGGHGFKALDDLEMIEVKQGPYLGDDDKTTFKGVDDDEIKF